MTFQEKDELLAKTVMDILSIHCSPKYKIIPSSRTTLSIFRQDKSTLIDNIKVKIATHSDCDGHRRHDVEYGLTVETMIVGVRYATIIEGEEAIRVFKEAYSRAVENCGENDFEYIIKDFVE